jgi:hypothetical protein
MSWNREKLEAEWIGAPIDALGDHAASAVSAFDCVEKHLGAAWLAQRLLQASGIVPTEGIVFLGECLAAIENLQGFEMLVEKVRHEDFLALSEMEAVWMFRLMGGVEVELAPALHVGGATKKPDFRVRRADERWTYVEVTHPDVSDAAVAAQTLLQRIQGVVAIRREFSMEIFLRREPNTTEEQVILAAATGLADSEMFETIDLPQVALITKQPFIGPIVTPLDHPGEDNKCPRFGAATCVTGGDGTEPQRLVSVRMPFSDDRADSFLKREAKQLSKSERGLIMMDMKATRSGIKSWVSLLRRRLQPDLHTRVGGICLFARGIELAPPSFQLLFDFATIENPHAHQTLPRWIFEEFRKMAIIDNAKRAVPRSLPSILEGQ